MKRRRRARKRTTKGRMRISVLDKTYVVTPAQLCLYGHLRELGYRPLFEQRVCSDREWRYDLFDPDVRLAWECNGGRWTGGHFRGLAVDKEYEKLNRAQLAGVRVIQFTNEFILEGKAKQFMKEFA